MRRNLRLSCLLVLTTSFALLSRAEDVKLREEAVRIMERANAVSLPGSLADYRQTVSFRVYNQDGTTADGSFSHLEAHGTRYREEESFGSYYAVSVRDGNRGSSTGNWDQPPELRELRDQLPVHLGRFDKEDVIRSIEDAFVLGRPAKCIQFETHFGTALQNNQLCMDAERGALLRWQVGEEMIENSDYFPVANLWEPAHIRRIVRGALRMEIEQKMIALTQPPDASLFNPPSGHWNRLFHCQSWRRAIGISTPQPPAGDSGTDVVDVMLHGFIRENGKVEALQVQSSPRPDLNAEALKAVAGWTFQPMVCDGVISTQEADFIVHFQGR